ncbi:MAG: M20/M25/M40 family metallo-hydrolase, partial [Hyphomicrobium sp.]
YASRLIEELGRIEQELKSAVPNVRFTPPYPTLQVTLIDGGTASNIVPVNANFAFEVRALPGLDTGSIETRLRTFAQNRCLPEMQSVAPEAAITIRQTNAVPPFAADRDSEVVALALNLAQQNETFAVSYATEAGLFQGAGAPSVVCGPGDIAQAHTANEWIAISELDKCMAFLGRLADWAEG